MSSTKMSPEEEERQKARAGALTDQAITALLEAKTDATIRQKIVADVLDVAYLQKICSNAIDLLQAGKDPPVSLLGNVGLCLTITTGLEHAWSPGHISLTMLALQMFSPSGIAVLAAIKQGKAPGQDKEGVLDELAKRADIDDLKTRLLSARGDEGIKLLRHTSQLVGEFLSRPAVKEALTTRFAQLLAGPDLDMSDFQQIMHIVMTRLSFEELMETCKAAQVTN